MQKQKNKSKVKGRELNRRGAEKEGTDMDAFVNTGIRTEEMSVARDLNMETTKELSRESVRDFSIAELTKDIKDKDNYESKKEKEATEAVKCEDVAEREPEPSAEEVVKVNVVHSSIPRPKQEKELLTTNLVQKNEENSKVCTLQGTKELEATGITNKSLLSLKYTYSDDQWSPININGKKVYGREFLMKLQNDPHSKVKPSNLPDLDVVLKDSTKTRSPVDLRFKDTNLGRHDSLFPGFVKSSLSAKVVSFTAETLYQSSKKSISLIFVFLSDLLFNK